MVEKPINYKEQDLVEFAAEHITLPGRDIEDIANWDANEVAEALANEIDTWLDNIELTDRQFKDLIEVLEQLIVKYESEISDRVQAYIEECKNASNDYYEKLVGLYV